MRFGNASTTVTGTVTPASVNTRVMPHLRPTRPMVIVNPHSARATIGPRVRCNQPAVWVRGTPVPSGLPSGRVPLDGWRRHPRAPTSKMDGGVYIVQALRASFYGADAAPPDRRSLRER